MPLQKFAPAQLQITDFLLLCAEYQTINHLEIDLNNLNDARISFVRNFQSKLFSHLAYVWANQIQPVFDLADKNKLDKCEIELPIFAIHLQGKESKRLILWADMYESLVELSVRPTYGGVEFQMNLDSTKIDAFGYAHEDKLETWLDNQQQFDNEVFFNCDFKAIEGLLLIF